MKVARPLMILLAAAAAAVLLPASAGAPALPAEPLGDAAPLAAAPLAAETLGDAAAPLPASVSVEAEASVGGVEAGLQADSGSPGALSFAVDPALADPASAGTLAEGKAHGAGLSPSSLAERVEPFAAPAVGSAVALTLGALAWRALAALLSPLPLFSRIERGSLLDNPVRARFLEVVAQAPGLSLTEVAERAGVAWGTAVHHLRRLEANGLVVTTDQGGRRRLFPANTPVAAQRAAVAAVSHPTARRIAGLVAASPGIDQRGICQALQLNNPAASKHLGRFEQQGLVLSRREGRSRHYHATGGLHSALVLLDPAAAGHPDLSVSAPQGVAA